MNHFYKLISIIPFLFLLASPISIFADNSGCAQHPAYIKPLSDDETKTLIKAIDDQPNLDDDTNYTAYVFNDQGNQYAIFTSIEGTAHVLHIMPYKKKSNNWVALDPIPLGDGSVGSGAGDSTYTNTLFNRDEFLTQICGHTYMSVNEDGGFHTYLWQNGKRGETESCDNNLTNYQRYLFQTLYSQHLYTAAANQQNAYLSRCKIDHQTILWMKNDIALAQLKDNDLTGANATLNEIETSPDLKNVSPSLKNAINFNKKLYQEKASQPITLDKPLGETAFNWMLDKKAWDTGDTLNVLPSITMMKLSELPSQIVPDISANLLYIKQTQAAESLKHYLSSLFDIGFITSNNNNNRYILISTNQGLSRDDSGELSDQSTEQPFYWIDTQTGTSVVGSFVRDEASDNSSDDSENGGLYITSRNYSPATVPAQTKQDLADFYKNIWDQKAFDLPIHFYDIVAKKNIDLPSSWLHSNNTTEQAQTITSAKDLINSKWYEYTNSEFGFKLSYPESLKTVNIDKKNAVNYSTTVYDSKPWSFESNDTGRTITFIPVLNLRDLKYYPGFYLVAVHIGVSNDSKVIKGCLNCMPGNKEYPSIAVNGTTFHVCEIEDGGAGSMTGGISYRTIHNNQCFSIEQIQSGPNGHGAFDKTSQDIPDAILRDYYYLAGRIIKTFKFSN